MIPNFDIDVILSDPMLLVGTVLFLFSPLVMIFGLYKYFTFNRNHKQPEISPLDDFESDPTTNPLLEDIAEQVHTPVEGLPEEISVEEPSETILSDKPLSADSQTIDKKPLEEVLQETISNASTANSAQEKTVLISAETADLQGQIEIAISQIRNLNKKFNELEQSVELLERHGGAKLDNNKLQEAPVNPADFTKKLLKLAEHVIVLEKEVARLKTSQGPKQDTQSSEEEESSSPSNKISVKPPIMPL